MFGWTPLHQAAYKGDVDEIEALVLTGHDIDARDRLMETPMHIAAAHGRVSVLEALVRLGSKAMDDLWAAPIYAAILNEQLDALTTMLVLGAERPAEIDEIFIPDEDEVHEIRWRVFFRESLVWQLLIGLARLSSPRL